MPQTALHKQLSDNSDEGTILTEPTADSSVVSTVSTRQQVRFGLEHNQTQFVTHLSELSPKHLAETWYTKREFHEIKKELIPLIKAMMKKEKVDETSSQTTRGLEYRTRAGTVARQNNKIRGYTAVLEDQVLQKALSHHKPFDHQRLAEKYITATSHCQQEAHTLALKDEQFVQRDLEKMRRKMDRAIERKLSSGSTGRTKGFLNRMRSRSFMVSSSAA